MKNTKIMAVLVVLLAAALCIGAASAAAPTQGDNTVNITYLNDSVDTSMPVNGLIITVGEKVTFNVTQNSSTGAVTVDWSKISLNYTTTEGYWDEGLTIKKAFSAASIAPFTFTEAGTYWIAAVNSTDSKFNSTTVKVIVEDVPAATAYGPVFVNQMINSSTFGQSGDITLYKLSGDATPATLDTIKVTDTLTRLLPDQVGSNTGVWYINAPSNTADYVAIWYPEITLSAELTTGDAGATSGDSIDGKTINKNTVVSFIIEASKLGSVNVNGAGDQGVAQAKIVFTTPVGGKTTTFGEYTPTGAAAATAANFVGLNMSNAQNIALKTGVSAGQNAAAGTWTAQAEFTSPGSFSDYAAKSNTVSFTVQSTSLTLTAAKDSVVRSNPFTVTIQGDSQMMYFIYLDGASNSDVNPTLQAGQSGMKTKNQSGAVEFGPATKNGAKLVAQDATTKYLNDTWGYFETDASGKRTVQYNTAADTEDKTYTVKVYALGKKYSELNTANPTVATDYDSVKVKVEKGSVTMSASGDGSYYIGDEIKLTGTNTDSDNIYLFLTGQNLNENGIVLKLLAKKYDAKYGLGQSVPVKTDDTWEYKWDTSKIGLDTGAYTIYATSKITNGKSSNPDNVTVAYDGTSLGDKYYTAVKLSDSEYATVSVNLKQPFLSATPSGSIIAQGDKLYVRGTAEGDPSNLKLYIFGPNFFDYYTITVEDDGSYEKKIDIGSSWASNQYFVVVQHPMYNGLFDAELIGTKDDDTMYFKINNETTGGAAGSQGSFVVWGDNKLQGSQAADALTKMIDDANIDDIYTKLTFTIAAPWIRIVNPGDQGVGSKFTITGTTNLAVDDQILVEVVSSSFTASDKTQTNMNSGISQTTKVIAGDTDNKWSVDVDTTNWKLDEYSIKVNGIEVDVTTTTNFNLVEKVVTTTPTTTPTKTPGFGAFIALAGLGAVALLVLRRN